MSKPDNTRGNGQLIIVQINGVRHVMGGLAYAEMITQNQAPRSLKQVKS